MSGRFFIDKSVSQIDGNTAVLGGDEAHHFLRVMRGKTGDSLELFDGTGILYRGNVTQCSKKEVSVQITQTLTDTVESPVRLTVASALPKGDRQHFLVEKLAELGAARFIPLHLERSVARANESVISRFKRCVIETAKQCERNILMEITGEMTLLQLDDFLRNEAENNTERYLLHPLKLGSVGQVTARSVLNCEINRPAILIGPEGSFTEKEIESALRFGFKPLDLGARILRTETAAIAAAAVFLTSDKH
ncbi:ribosomal RNA small subunit methyltransferase E [Planctomycetales bacterium]|nr:ribosomal RNA small subunit methyltransferase E [Planctomycetales bacterium]